tara:strand:- start:14 stop:499 length:486 start_codon:yes stop_codon:yes gene_type:complete
MVAGTVTAQQDPPPEATGDLAEVMRGILFPNSNLLFDAQSKDPGAPPEAVEGDSASARFASIYTGWETVENAAIALAEAANLITLPGRSCENGQPVPVEQDNWKEFVVGLREAGERAYAAALNQSQEEVIDATNYVAEACSNCHSVYRDSYEDPPKERCVP